VAATRSYTLYLTDTNGAPIAPGIVVTAYPYGAAETDANVQDRCAVSGANGTVYFNNLSPGIDYNLDSNDASFGPSYFHSGAIGQVSIQSGATPPTGGGGGSTPAPSTKIVATGMGTWRHFVCVQRRADPAPRWLRDVLQHRWI
jgi:hypothetical protein